MAQIRRSPTKKTEPSPDEPLLRQGRRADPGQKVPPELEQPSGPEKDADEPGQDTRPEDGSVATDIEKTVAESRQRKLRLLLRQCDRVLLMDFELLAMSDWPDNYTVAAARRGRDVWLFSSLLAAVVFVSGMTGLVPAWIAGSGFGVFVILLLYGLPSIRRVITRTPSYLDLIIKRRRMLQDARKHIQHLEGDDGLAWQCARMAEFNTALRAMRFNQLLVLSERRQLAKHLTRREHVRLYLIFMLEAEKAYSRAEKAFFEGHQQAVDKGWESVAASSEGKA